MPGGFGTPYRPPCGGWPAAPKLYLGCGNHVITAHKTIPRYINTTIAPSDPCEPQTWSSPVDRGANSPIAAESGCLGGDPVGAWPDPVPQNTYAAPGPSENQYWDASKCHKRGFKNVYAQKQWHGAEGPMSNSYLATQSMNGDGSCQIRENKRTSPEPYRFRSMSITARKVVRIHQPNGTSEDTIYDQRWDFTSQDTVARYTGKHEGGRTLNYTGSGITPPSTPLVLPSDLSDFINDAISTSKENGHLLYNSLAIGSSYTNGAAATYNHTDGSGDVHVGSIVFPNCTTDCSITNPGLGLSVINTQRIGLDANGLASRVIRHYTYTSNYIDPLSDEPGYDVQELYCEVVWSNLYTWSHVQNDMDTLLATWNLGDDVQYPWRDTTAVSTLAITTETQTDSAIVTGGPLVTYNERGESAPGLWPADIAGEPYVDNSLPPRQDYPDGSIVGAPLPNGYEAFYDFKHIEHEFVTATYGITAIPKYFGQWSPFPHATQWLDNITARFIPIGPFCTYNGIFNPELVKSDGSPILIEFGAMKCKWAEIALRPARAHNFFRPCGSDDRGTWGADYRPICGRITITSATQSGGNVLIVLSEAAPGLITGDSVDFTSVPGLGTGLSVTVTDSTHFSVAGTLTTSPTLGGYVSSNGAPSYGWNDTNRKGDFVYKVWVNDFLDFFESYRQRMQYDDSLFGGCTATDCDPVRYVAVTPDSGERNEIGTGSYWLKSLTVTEHCLNYSPCVPAVIYVSPNTETGHANSITMEMPGTGLVADQIYGSLWISNVEQVMPDPLGVESAEEARATLPSGAPAMPAASTPLGCPDYVNKLNEDPQVVVGGLCAAPYRYTLFYNPTSNQYSINSGEPLAVTLAWGI